MLSALLAEWLHKLPEIALGYLIAFGVRIGGDANKPWFQIHGVVTSFWLVAQGIAGAKEEFRNESKLVNSKLDRCENKLESCEKKLDTIESKLGNRDGELRFSIRQ